MSGFISGKQLVLLYIHPSDFDVISAAATAAHLSLPDFLLLAAWMIAREEKICPTTSPNIEGKK